MPSILDLFGELDLKNDSFNRKLKDSVGQMQSADTQLNKVISSSNKLGDTSATVSRRYEKLAEGIALQNTRLKEAVSAYQSDEVSAKKFESTLASVETQTRNLTSRIKDAQARVTELDQTGLTHFQNQIQGAITKSSTLGDVLRNLSAFQKQQLGYQANDIISGLLSGQNPTQILAQQGGQIVQVFQQGKLAQEGLATATNAAAAAETKLVALSELNNVSVAASVNQMIAYRAETEGAAAATIGLGTKLGLVGAAIGVALGDYYLIKKEISIIEEKGKERLATEEAIAGAINKQYLAASNLQDALAKAQGERDFQRQLDSYGNLSGWQGRLTELYNQDAKELADKMSQLDADLLRSGITDKAYREAQQNKLKPTGFDELQAQRFEQILAIAARIDERKHKNDVSGVDWYTNVMKQRVDAQKFALEAQTKAQEKAAKASEEYARKVHEAAVKIDERIKSLNTEYLKTPQKLLEAAGYSRQAQEFRQGFRFGPESVSETLQRQLSAIIPTKFQETIAGYVSGGALPPGTISRVQQVFNQQKLNRDEQHAIDQQIVALTRGLNPEELTYGQRQLAAAAFERESQRDKDEIKDTIKDLRDAIKSGHIIRIVDKTRGRVEVTTTGSQGDVDNLYD